MTEQKAVLYFPPQMKPFADKVCAADARIRPSLIRWNDFENGWMNHFVEKQDGSGNIDYTPENHERMVHLRAEKIARIASDIPPATLVGDPDADLCILGWGSTWAAIDAAVQRARRGGAKVAWIHVSHLNPLPANLGDLLRGFRHVLVPELNLGQLARLVRSEYLVDARSLSKVQGLPFTAHEIEDAIHGVLSPGA